MARAGKVAVPPNVPTEITNADAAGAITFQNLSASPVRMIGTPTGVVPVASDFGGALFYAGGQGQVGMTLDEIFPGAGYACLWAWSATGATICVYHA